MMVDILAFGAHPDDVELGCAGTLALQISKGHKIAIVDLTEGELGTRGSVKERYLESAKASDLLGIHHRVNLKLPDGFIHPQDISQKMAVIKAIRSFQPKIILANAFTDRHPDHGNACRLIEEAVFLAGLEKIETLDANGHKQQAFRTTKVLHYIQDRYIKPDIIIDISNFYGQKMEAIKAYSSQFYNPKSSETATYIASETFLKTVEARALEFGKVIGVTYGEGFTAQRILGLSDLSSIL